MSDGVEESILAALDDARGELERLVEAARPCADWTHITREDSERLAAVLASVEGDRVRPARTGSVMRGEPRPDYDPRIDHPERYTDGPI
jgi:hypothetical protein